jgi:hypothetical protein
MYKKCPAIHGLHVALLACDAYSAGLRSERAERPHGAPKFVGVGDKDKTNDFFFANIAQKLIFDKRPN